jgi:hypothetical protein
MPEATIDQTADKLVTAADAVFNAAQAGLNGAGALFQEFQGITAQARQIPQMGSTMAANIKAIQEDPGLTAEAKAARVAKINANADQIVRAAEKDLRMRLDAFEHSALDALLPPANTDTRALLVRQELELLMRASRPIARPGAPQPPVPSLLGIFTEAAKNGQNAEQLAEILGPWGQAQMKAAGEARAIPELRGNVAKIIAMSPGGNAAIKGALKTLSQVKGQAVAYSQAARWKVEAAQNTSKAAFTRTGGRNV